MNTKILLSALTTLLIFWVYAHPQGQAEYPHENGSNAYMLVTDFGATPDDELPDGEGIQKALDALRQKGGGTLFFPAGKYLVKRILIPPSNSIIIGEGRATLLQFSFPAHSETNKVYYGWVLTGQKHITFQNIAMDGGAKNIEKVPVDADGAHHLIYFAPEADGAVSHIIIKNCYFSGSFDSAIQSYGRFAHKYPHPFSDYITIENCVFFNLGSHGVGMNEWRNSSVRECTFENIGLRKMVGGYGSGMAVDVSAGSENIIVSDNFVSGAAAGFKAEAHTYPDWVVSAKNVIISNNFIQNLYEGPDFNVWYGIRVNAGGVVVKNNYIESFSHGILVTTHASNCVLEGNTVFSTKAKDAAGIRIDEKAETIKVIGNSIFKAAAQGIVSMGKDILLDKNFVTNCGLDGIRIAGENTICQANICKNNGGQGIAISAINKEIKRVVLSNNVVYSDNNTSESRQQRGIYVAPDRIQDVRLDNQISYGNSIGDLTILAPTYSKNGKLYAKTPPTTGNWQAGDLVYNSNPKPGTYLGWVCIESGSPGKWAGFGLINP